MKYMIMMFGSAGDMVATQPREWNQEMIAFMHQLDQDLTDAGELVHQQGRADASTTKTVSPNNGDVVVTDGPYPETKESLIGFWVVDVDTLLWTRLPPSLSPGHRQLDAARDQTVTAKRRYFVPDARPSNVSTERQHYRNQQPDCLGG